MQGITSPQPGCARFVQEGLAQAALRRLKALVRRIWLDACARAGHPQRVIPYY
ncbi:MAG TPA: hypothetical protein PKB14_14650 [Rubrivivax sp.]|nr:hypothetical protein [Rubrivivax sp.]